ncbi:hypothetical protein HYW58_02170 [Candidatus Kaiserbacteria bacterium]|nr:hypothetical protein [Candidatus Kaiserbacteria bacterium]
MFRTIKKKKEILLAFAGAGFFILVFFLAQPAHSLAEYAEEILYTCSNEEYRPACYDREIPKLMDLGISMEDAFTITRLVQEKDNSYFYCHVLGHNLSAKETAKDPSKWKEVITRAPSGMCSNGGIHGAFQERFRVESLPDATVAELESLLAGICQKRDGWDPTLLEQATCTHAIGHLAMYVTGGDIQKSLELCNQASFNDGRYDFRPICFDGVFMQLFQPLEPEDFALIEGKQPVLETVDAYCEQFNGAQFKSCRSESWPLYGEAVEAPEGIARICSPIEDKELQFRCYSGMFYVVTASRLNLDEGKMTDFCSQFSQERKNQCFANAASRMIETDWRKIPASVAFCARAKRYGAEDACYEELLLYSTYNFHAGSKEFFELCKALPQMWKSRCLEAA